MQNFLIGAQIRKTAKTDVIDYGTGLRTSDFAEQVYRGRQALEVLEQEESDTENDEMMEIINSTVGKLQQIEDKYYYSLDLNYYLNNLENDAYEA